jgi:hypothetical protein
MAFLNLEHWFGQWLPISLKNFTFNFQKTSANPDVEARIFTEAVSPGRQLGWIIEAVDALIDANQGYFAEDERARATRDQFLAMEAQIAAVKHAQQPGRFVHHPEQYIALVEKLRCKEPKAYAAVKAKLREWSSEKGPGPASTDGHGVLARPAATTGVLAQKSEP